MGILKQIAIALVLAFIVLEMKHLTKRLSHWLVRRAAERLPLEDREQFVEVNLADVDAIEGPFSKLYNAIDCFNAAASLIDTVVAPNTATSSQLSIGVRLVAGVLFAGALWDLFATFYGLAGYFDLPLNPGINPVQFIFGLVLTAIVFGFVIATHLIWSMKGGDDLMVQALKAAWGACIAINLITSWQGTKHFVFYGDDGDAARGIGLALAAALTISSTIFLSRLVLGRQIVR